MPIGFQFSVLFFNVHIWLSELFNLIFKLARGRPGKFAAEVSLLGQLLVLRTSTF